jgi:hypothetical protein
VPRPRIASASRLAIVLGAGALLLGGCGASAEPGAASFLREHKSEAVKTAAAVMTLSRTIKALPARPTTAQLETLSLTAHRAHRTLLAATDWTVSEDGEEEGVSQAEKEIHEGSEALLAATGDARLYSLRLRSASLAAYRRELAAGREYWNQGIAELWYVAKKPSAPKIQS